MSDHKKYLMDICPKCGGDISLTLYECPHCGAKIEEDYLLDEHEQVSVKLRNVQNVQNEDMINKYQQELNKIEGSEEYKHACVKKKRCKTVEAYGSNLDIESILLKYKYHLLFFIIFVGIIVVMVTFGDHTGSQPTMNSSVAASDTTLSSDTSDLIVSDVSNDAPKHYVGIWRISNPEFPHDTYTEIYEQGGVYYEENYDEGQEDRASKSMLKKDGNKYYDPEDAFGEYYIVKNGQLRYYNENGDFTDEVGYKIKRIK